MQGINNIASDLGLTQGDLEHYGSFKAKLTDDGLQRLQEREPGRLVLVTGINPTASGEGKTTVSIGLAQALRRQQHDAVVALREPSIGPVMGIKGGGTGGGESEILPSEEINLHFNGDLHAVTAANNLLSAVIDNSLFHGNPLSLDPRRITWRRCLDVNDRSLRNTIVGVGGVSEGIPREEKFDITPASEIMAILAVASDLDDLHERLSGVISGYTYDREPVFAADFAVETAMAVLLKQALRPNLVQTTEGGPAFVHAGPFANIALGCSSLIGTRAALGAGEIVITEAGFGSEVGAEKFFNVVSRIGDLNPEVAVIVCTARALKRHGGVDPKLVSEENVLALEAGFPNLDAHIDNVQQHQVFPVVAVNRFPSDTDEEISSIISYCEGRKIHVAEVDPYGAGGAGCLDLGDAVSSALSARNSTLQFLYKTEDSVTEKIETVARKVYGAEKVVYLPQAQLALRRVERLGMGNLPICIAKTQYSLSDDPNLLGRPVSHEFSVREIRPSAGAGFLVVISGKIVTMPGLPREPAATKFTL